MTTPTPAPAPKKNTLKFSPRQMDPANPMYGQGFTWAAVEVASGVVVKGFTNEGECQEFVQKQNEL